MSRSDERPESHLELVASRMSQLYGLFPLMHITLPNIVFELPEIND